MEKEQWYPVYRFEIWWEITHPMTKYDNMGNAVECSSWDRQYREPPTPEELESEVRRLWLAFLVAERSGGCLPTLADRGAKLIGYRVTMVEIETWYQIWFQHVSLNTHLSDEELLESFRRFVQRKTPADVRLRMLGPEEKRTPDTEYYCLMGAEDRWRWKGPCRCEHCQAQGVVRIDH